ncbi:MAG: sensor histidine kinase [Nocardioidaceae bacterium]|nr:sensor histidine kinase [Nocardioidaceae bacterium]
MVPTLSRVQALRADVDDHSRGRWSLPGVLGPLALAAFQLAGTFGASREQPERRAVDLVAVLLVLAGPAALLWVRQRPDLVAGFVSGVTLSYLLAGYAYGPVFLSLAVALFVAVLLGHRRAAWLSAAAVYVGHFALRGPLRDESWSWGPPLAVGAWVLLVLAAGEVGRVRRERALDARRARAETERRQANEERLRIARELHDVVAHHMSLINVQAGVALHLVDRKPEQARTALAAIKGASKEALVELRSLVGVLRDETEAAPRSPVSMLESLDDLADRSAHAGLSVRRVVTGTDRPLPAAVQLAAFRIIQEAITNVVRHSGARNAVVRLDYGDAVLTVQVDDDGSGGASAHDLEPGSGLRGMHERAAALGGTLEVLPATSGGLRVEAELPIGRER